jgi:hypothetical protein
VCVCVCVCDTNCVNEMARVGGLVPDIFVGLWSRKLLTCPGSVPDDTTVVYYLQTKSGVFADIRIPASCAPILNKSTSESSSSSSSSLADLSPEELRTLSLMKGFGGTFECNLTTNICKWNREIDFQPTAPPAEYLPDESNFRFESLGSLLIETGIHEEFEEVWERQTEVGLPTAAYRLGLAADPVQTPGILVTVGSHFLLILSDRSEPLPLASSLQLLVNESLEAEDKEKATKLIDMTIEYGEIGSDEQYLVKYSTKIGAVGSPSKIVSSSQWTKLDD